MKIKRIVSFVCVFLMLLALPIYKVDAQEETVSYVNSEESKTIADEDWFSGASIINDGGYKAGVPGEYEIEYQKVGTSTTEKLKVIIVQSEGTVIGIRPKGANIVNVDKSFFNDYENTTAKLDALASKKLKVILTVKMLDQSIVEIESDVINNYGGAGGVGDDLGIFQSYGSGYWAKNAQRRHGEVKSAADVKYYNSLIAEDGYDYGFSVNFTAVYNANKPQEIVTGKNDIKVETKIPPSLEGGLEVYASIEDTILSDKVKAALATPTYKSFSVIITDEAKNLYESNDGTKISVKLDSNFNDKKIKVYSLEGEKLIEIANEVENGYVHFITPKLPAEYIVAGINETGPIIKPEDDNGLTSQKTPVGVEQKNAQNKSSIIKTNDSGHLSIYLVMGIVSIGTFITVQKKSRKLKK